MGTSELFLIGLFAWYYLKKKNGEQVYENESDLSTSPSFNSQSVSTKDYTSIAGSTQRSRPSGKAIPKPTVETVSFTHVAYSPFTKGLTFAVKTPG